MNVSAALITGAFCFPTASHILETDVFPELVLLFCLHVELFGSSHPQIFLCPLYCPCDAVSISCFSLGRITKWGCNFKASKVGELNRGLINALRKVSFNLMPRWTNSSIVISSYPPAIKRQVKSKSYPCIQVLCLNTLRNYTHKSKSLGHFSPFFELCVHCNRWTIFLLLTINYFPVF